MTPLKDEPWWIKAGLCVMMFVWGCELIKWIPWILFWLSAMVLIYTVAFTVVWAWNFEWREWLTKEKPGTTKD